MCDGRLDLGQVCVLTGRFDEAREWFERARVVLDEEGSRSLRAIVDYVEAESIARRGMPAAQGRVDALVASRPGALPGDWNERLDPPRPGAVGLIPCVGSVKEKSASRRSDIPRFHPHDVRSRRNSDTGPGGA